MGDGPIVIGVWRKVIGGCILTTTHGLITIGLTTDGAILTTTGDPIIIGVIISTINGPMVIGVRRKVIGGPILTTTHGSMIVGLTIDGGILTTTDGPIIIGDHHLNHGYDPVG